MELKNALVAEKKLGGPYISAVFDPNEAKFREMLGNSSHSILEIGCGKEPRLSWKIGSRDLWVGCDPAIGFQGISVSIHKGVNPVNANAQLVVFPDKVADIPKFTPDVLIAVAPNQKDIVEDNIFNSELEDFLDSRKEQVFIVTLDTITREALGYQEDAIEVIKIWMRRNGFEKDNENPALDRFMPNSADLGASNIRMCFVREP